MQRIERGAGPFPFLAVLDGIFDALYAGRTFALHRFGRYAAKPQGHAKPCTNCTIPRIAEWCNPYAQTADISRIRQALIFLT